MNVTTVYGLQGASAARGLGIFIDVFRGSSTVIALFFYGAKSIIPAVSLKQALKLKRENPNHLLVGEKSGKTPPGFDCGNSPFEVSTLDLESRSVIFRSSAASRGILTCKRSKTSELLIGGFVNASSVVRYVKERKPREVTLIAIGTLGFGKWREAEEDSYCALYLMRLLQGEKVSFHEIKKKVLQGEGFARLIRLNQANDSKICMHRDVFDGIIPRVERNGRRMRIVCVQP